MDFVHVTYLGRWIDSRNVGRDLTCPCEAELALVSCHRHKKTTPQGARWSQNPRTGLTRTHGEELVTALGQMISGQTVGMSSNQIGLHATSFRAVC